MSKLLKTILLYFFSNVIYALPSDFVYLHDVNSRIQQDIRYAGQHNFIGRPVHGYEKPKCILTRKAAQALSQVQKELEQSSLSLKVYDCYRPTMAVENFIAWSKALEQQQMQNEFYPRIDKTKVFELGYIAEKSGHSRGSTVDLTIVAIPFLPSAKYRPGQKLTSCISPYLNRFRDSSIDMGTGYDCLDELASPLNRDVGVIPFQHRMLLRELMVKYGFVPYEKEWWHFTLKDEPYPDTYFNFVVR